MGRPPGRDKWIDFVGRRKTSDGFLLLTEVSTVKESGTSANVDLTAGI